MTTSIAPFTTKQTAQLAVLHARGWTITTHETDDRQRLRVTGTQPDGTMFRGWLDANGQFTGQPTDPSRSTQRFGVGAPTEVRS